MPPFALPAPRRASGLILLLAVCLTALNLRTAVTGFSAVVDIVQESLLFGPTVTGLLGTLITGCFAACAFVAPVLARRFGLEHAVLGAVAITTVGLALRAAAESAGMLIAATVVGFAGVGAANVLLIPIVKEHFPDRVKAVSTLYMLLLQVGQFVAPVVGVKLATAAGWRVSLGLWPALTGIATLLWLVVVLRTSRRAGLAEAEAESPRVAPPVRRVTGQRPSTATLGLVGLMAMTALHTYALITWIPSMFADAGLSAVTSATLLSLFSAMGLLAALVVPGLAGHMRNPFPIVVICVALLLAGYLGMLSAPASGAALWAVLLGLGVSTFPLTLTLIGLRSSTAAESASLSGIVQGVGYGIGCIGPLALGALNTATGSWDSSYAVLIASLAVTLIAGWNACRPVTSLGNRAQ
jgi:CP family cyanate transporter-like MFS transporter